MKKQLLFFVLLAQFITNSSAQITFQKTYGDTGYDVGYSVQETAEGGYIISGITNSLYADSGFYVFKTDANGDTLWTTSYVGGNEGWGFAGYSVKQTSNGGFFLVGGSYESSGGFPYLYTDSNGNGNGQFNLNSRFSQGSHDFAYSLQSTKSGGYIIAGATQPQYSSFDVVLCSGLVMNSYGGTGDDFGRSVQQTNDGGYIVAGTTFSFGADSGNVYLIKTDSSLNLLWSKIYGGTVKEEGNSIQITNDGGYIIAGNSYSAGNSDILLIKTDSIGDTLWVRTYGGSGNDFANSVQKTNDGGYIVAGSTTSFGVGGSDVYLVKTDSSGNILWSKTYGGPANDFGYSVQQTKDSGYIIVGATWSFGAGNSDVYLIKTDANGNSGCNETNPLSLATLPSPPVSNPTTSTGSSTPHNTGLPPPYAVKGSIMTNLCSPLQIKEVSQTNWISISPNPGDGNFDLSISDNEFRTVKLNIYNIMGQNIYSSENKNNSNVVRSQIHLNTPAGIYLIRESDGEKQYIQKLIIE